jgi:hypothetical protein
MNQADRFEVFDIHGFIVLWHKNNIAEFSCANLSIFLLQTADKIAITSA